MEPLLLTTYLEMKRRAEELDIISEIRKSNLVTFVTSLVPEDTGALDSMFELDELWIINHTVSNEADKDYSYDWACNVLSRNA